MKLVLGLAFTLAFFVLGVSGGTATKAALPPPKTILELRPGVVVAAGKTYLDCLDELSDARTVSIKEGPQNATVRLKELIQSGCDTLEVRRALAVALSAANSFGEAEREYRVIISRAPKDWVAHWSLAQLLVVELGKYDEGLSEVTVSRKLDDMGENGYLYDFFLAKAYDGLTDSQRALSHYRKFVRGATKNAPRDSRLPEARKRIDALARTDRRK